MLIFKKIGIIPLAFLLFTNGQAFSRSPVRNFGKFLQVSGELQKFLNIQKLLKNELRVVTFQLVI